MNGIHDMGGMTDFGAVAVEPDEPLFHADWERRVLGMVRTTIDGRYNWDEFRFAIERLDPVEYLSASYYERWLSALERYLIEKGDVSEEALRVESEGAAPRPGLSVPRLPPPASGGGTDFTFGTGQIVTVRNTNPPGHTRLPRYVRGKQGTVDRVLGMQTFPDSNALGTGSMLRPVYSVRFRARELWGRDANPRDTVCVDLWEEYLEA